MKRAIIAGILIMLLMPSAALADGGGDNLLLAIDESSIAETADPHVFALRGARERTGQVGTLNGNADLSILPEYQNVCVNPRFYDGSDADTIPDSWTTASTVDGTIQYETNENSAVRITYTALASDVNDVIMLYSSAAASASPGDYFSLSAGVNGRASGVNAFLMIQAYTNGDAIGNNVTYLPLTSLTRRFSVLYHLPAGTNGVRAFIYIDDIDNGDSIDIRIVSANLNSSLVARECTGSGEDGCYWSGATNSSYSIHPAESISVSAAITTARALELWWRPDFGSDDSGTVTLVRDSSNLFFVMDTGDTFTLNVGGYPVTVDQAFDPGDVLHIIARWDNGVQLTVNGVTNTSQSGDRGDALHVVDLCHANGGSQCNGELIAARFYGSLSDDDVMWLYNGGAGRSLDEILDSAASGGGSGEVVIDPSTTFGDIVTITLLSLIAGLVIVGLVRARGLR